MDRYDGIYNVFNCESELTVIFFSFEVDERFFFCQSALRKPQNKSQTNKLLASSVCGQQGTYIY